MLNPVAHVYFYWVLSVLFNKVSRSFLLDGRLVNTSSLSMTIEGVDIMPYDTARSISSTTFTFRQLILSPPISALNFSSRSAALPQMLQFGAENISTFILKIINYRC